MTTKRTKGFASLDLVLPVAPHYRNDPQVLKDVEKMRTNAASRWAKYDHSQTPSGFQNNNTDSSSKLASLARPKVEVLRANSPTLKRLLAVRAKLEKYVTLGIRTFSASRQSMRSRFEAFYPTIHEKPSSVLSKPLHEKLSSALSKQTYSGAQAHSSAIHLVKPLQSKSGFASKPLDKITYEKTWTHNGNVKQKCSLEIWLPKPGLDDDDDDDGDGCGLDVTNMCAGVAINGDINDNISRTSSAEIDTRKKTERPSLSIPVVKSRRPSAAKITATTTVTNMEEKSLEETSQKKSETALVPRVYHYADYIMDIPEERPRSSKSVTTVKSDGGASIRSVRRQHTRPLTGRLSNSTNHSEEILRFGTIEVPTSAKYVSTNIKSASTSQETRVPVKSVNPSMIHDLMHKYSLIKKNHQELTQAKLHLEKPSYDAKTISTVSKADHSPRPRPPPVPESTALVSSDHPSVSVKKLLLDATFPRAATSDHNNHSTTTNIVPPAKLLERRATPRKPSYPDVNPQLRIFSLANQQQHRQSSASIAAAYLPTVAGKKPEEIPRVLQRSKTLDVVLDVSSSNQSSSRVTQHVDNSIPHRTQRSIHGLADSTTLNNSNRSASNLNADQKRYQQNRSTFLSNSRTHLQRSTTTTSTTATSIPNNKVLVHFNHSKNGNLDRGYLVPE